MAFWGRSTAANQRLHILLTNKVPHRRFASCCSAAVLPTFDRGFIQTFMKKRQQNIQVPAHGHGPTSCCSGQPWFLDEGVIMSSLYFLFPSLLGNQPPHRSKLSGHMVPYYCYCYITGLNSFLSPSLPVCRSTFKNTSGPDGTRDAVRSSQFLQFWGAAQLQVHQHLELLPPPLQRRLCFWSDFRFLFPGQLPDDVWH